MDDIELNRIYQDTKNSKYVIENLTKWSEKEVRNVLSVELKTRRRKTVITRLQGRLNKLRNIRINKKQLERIE